MFQGRANMRARCALTAQNAADFATAVPACASMTGDTAATFSVEGGGLAITVPPSTVNRSSVSTSTRIIAQLDTDKATDTGVLVTAVWTSLVTTTGITTDGGTGRPTRGERSPLATSLRPHLHRRGRRQVRELEPFARQLMDAAALAGTYKGTVTHSVA
jgi:hypothetical protein